MQARTIRTALGAALAATVVIAPTAEAVAALNLLRHPLPQSGIDAADVIAQLDRLASPATVTMSVPSERWSELSTSVPGGGPVMSEARSSAAEGPVGGELLRSAGGGAAGDGAPPGSAPPSRAIFAPQS